MHRIKKAVGPSSPPTAIAEAAKALWRRAQKPLIPGMHLPEAKGPGIGRFLTSPVESSKRYIAGQKGHLRRLAQPGGVRKALLDITPMSIGMMAIPELLNVGMIRGMKDAPSEQKGEYLGGAAGRLIGGQLMGRAGILGSIAGGMAGDMIGGSAGRMADRVRKTFKKEPPEEPMAYDSDFSGYQFGPGYAKAGSSFGDPGAELPEVAGTAPALAMGGPGMDEVKGKGRFVGRNGPYRKVDEFQDIGSPEAQQIFYAGNGLGSGGGQPYADGNKYTHTGILQGLLNRLNKPVDPTVSEM